MHRLLLNLLLLLLIYSTPTLGRVPQKAQVGDTIHISVPKAFFPSDSLAWVKISMHYQDGEAKQRPLFIKPLTLTQNQFSAEFSVPENTARATFLYLTKDTLLYDPQTLRIVDSTQKYVSRARMLGHVITGKSYAMLKSELQDFPENVDAMQEQWQIQDEIHTRSSMAFQLKNALPKLSAKVKTPQVYYTMIWAAAKIDSMRFAMAMFEELLNAFPNSPYILKSFQCLDDAAGSEFSEAFKDCEKKVAHHLVTYPDLERAFNYGYLLTESDSTDRAIHHFFQTQIKIYGHVPLIYFHAAQTYQHRLNFPAALMYGVKARELLSKTQVDSAYFSDRFHGQNYKALWPHLSKTLVISHMAQKQYSEALTVLENGYSNSGNSEIDSELWTLEARCHELLKNYAASEKLYIKAYKRGLIWTKESLRDLYLKQHKNTSESEFNRYFQQILKNH